ncbi:MAG: hypothetical protein AAGG51_20560 [Cyanobacteria bacterium P01_G01_bin.54]
MMIVSYDINQYQFREWACSILRVKELDHLHERLDLNQYSNYVEKIEACRAELTANITQFSTLMLKFMRREITPLFNGIENTYLHPTFRVHIPGGKTASKYHLDRDYGVDPRKLNVWLPFTKVWGGNSIWIESEEGLGDFLAVNLEYGEALVFDGSNLCHGSVKNDTSSTRVSVDFRFIPLDRSPYIRSSL